MPENPRRPRRQRVLIVDDAPVFADTLELLLGTDDRVEIVGMARDGEEGVQLAESLRPDVVVMDVHMPTLDGIEATRLIKRRHRSTRVVVVTSSPTRECELRARAAGAAAFLPKDTAFADLTRAVAGPQPNPMRRLRLRTIARPTATA
jgi:DNA-binding NarL/FixJ family response regulator